METPITQTITVTGEDKLKFLQGQITADLNLLESEDYIISAYCNRQGRVISVFYIVKNNNDYVLLFIGDTAEIFIDQIKKYSVFSKISFSNIFDTACTDALDKLNNNIVSKLVLQQTGYYIENKIPVIYKQHSGEFLPGNLNLIDLGAVSFKKGCFLGQEIIARVFYKGKNKKELAIIKDNSAMINIKDCTSLIQHGDLAQVVIDIDTDTLCP